MARQGMRDRTLLQGTGDRREGLMTDKQWDEIGAALCKANDGKWPTEHQRPFVDMSDILEYGWPSGNRHPGSGEPYEFSWLTRKLFGWLL